MFWIILVPNPIKEFCTQHTEGVVGHRTTAGGAQEKLVLV